MKLINAFGSPISDIHWNMLSIEFSLLKEKVLNRSLECLVLNNTYVKTDKEPTSIYPLLAALTSSTVMNQYVQSYRDSDQVEVMKHLRAIRKEYRPYINRDIPAVGLPDIVPHGMMHSPRSIVSLIEDYLPHSLIKRTELKGVKSVSIRHPLKEMRNTSVKKWIDSFTNQHDLTPKTIHNKVYYLPKNTDTLLLSHPSFDETLNPKDLFVGEYPDFVYRDLNWVVYLIPKPNTNSILHLVLTDQRFPREYNYFQFVELYLEK